MRTRVAILFGIVVLGFMTATIARPWLAHAQERPALSVEFPEGRIDFCRDDDRVEVATFDVAPDAIGFDAADVAAAEYLNEIKRAASSANRDLASLSAEDQLNATRVFDAFYQPAVSLAALFERRSTGGSHYFDKVLEGDAWLAVRLVVDEMGSGYLVTSSYICASEILTDEGIDYGHPARKVLSP